MRFPSLAATTLLVLALTAHFAVRTTAIPGVASAAPAKAALMNWASNYALKSNEQRTALIQQGCQLAKTRGEHIRQLIVQDPESALREGLSWAEYERLPAEIRALGEEPFSATADWTVEANCDDKGSESTFITMDGQHWQTKPYGTRQALTTKRGIPLQGIRLAGWAAVQPTSITPVSKEDAAAAQRLLAAKPTLAAKNLPIGNRPLPTVPPPADAKPLPPKSEPKVVAKRKPMPQFAAAPASENAAPVVSGGKVRWLTDSDAFTAAESALADSLNTLGPNAALTATESLTTDSAWSEGTKRILIIAIDFPDKPGVSVSAQTLAEKLMARGYTDYRENSYDKLLLDVGYAPTVVRMPQPTTYYLPTNHILMHDDAVAALAASGYNVASFDFKAVYFENISLKDNFGSTIAGKGEIGGTRMWLQGTNNASYHVLMHEFGHNLGLAHASGWLATGTDPLGAGTHYEYGDPYDLMGGGTMPDGFFHPQAKRKLGWLDNTSAPTAATSGVYRLERIDHPQATGARGLKIVRAGGEDNFWLSYRRRYPGFPLLARGLHITHEWPNRSRCWLVDTTPNSSLGFRDDPLPLGKTYADPSVGIYVTPIAQGGSDATEWLDVRVNIGTFPGNHAPAISSLDGPSTIAARTAAVFTTSASDSDGDPLSYHWNFGDGDVSANAPAITKIFTTGGTYTLTLTVSDGKGMTAVQTKSITVTNGLITWNTRTSGVGSLNCITNNGNIAVAGSGASVIARSTDGANWTFSYPSGGGAFNRICWDGTRFICVGSRVISGAWGGVIFTSPDGISWTQRFAGGSELWSVASNGTIAVAAGRNGYAMRSTDGGITWTAITSPANRFFQGAAYGAGKFMLVGYSNSFWRGDKIILTSSDGLTWTDVTLTHVPGDTLYNANYINGKFWVNGYSATIASSTDLGATWNSANTMESYDTYGLAYGNGIYFANAVSFNVDYDLISPDGLRWIAVARTGQSSLYDVTFFKNTFITIGLYGAIQQSNPIPNAPTTFETWANSEQANINPAADSDHDGLTDELEYAIGTDPHNAGSHMNASQTFDGSNQILHLPWNNKRGDVNYQVQASTDLVNWSNTGIVITETAGELKACLPAPGPGNPKQFMRVKVDVVGQ